MGKLDQLPVYCLFLLICGASGVRVDMAQGKNTFQSTTYGELGYPYLAVDGCEDPNYYTTNCGCTHTADNKNNPWWTVELVLPSTIHSVEIMNRADCCHDRLSNFKIYAMSDSRDPDASSDKVQCKHFTGTVPSGSSGWYSIDCDQRVVGSYLSIQIPGDNKQLTLCEVRVWADSHSHYGPIWNYAQGRPVSITNDLERRHIDHHMSDYVVDNDHSTCPNRLVSGNQNGKMTVTMPHEVAIKKVRVHQSPVCAYYCSTQIDLSGWGYEDMRDGCNSGSSSCWVGNGGIDHIIVNGTDTNQDGYDGQSRGWNVVVIDECGCTVKDRLEIDHFSDGQQSGCMDPDANPRAFSPFINSLDDGDIMIGVSEDEVQRGMANCYIQGLKCLGVNTDFEYRAAVVFIAKKGYPEFTQTVIRERTLGPATLTNLWIGAAPNHEFTAGFTTQTLGSSLTQECGTYHGLIGAGDVGVLECDDPPVGVYFQLNFPTIGVHLCEVELFLGNMAEFCGDSDTCWYIPSRKWDTTADGEWECRAQYASAKLAEVTSADFTTAQNELTSDSDLTNVASVMVGAERVGGTWTYVDSGGSVPASVYGSESGDILYIPRSGSAASSSSGGDDHYVLCEVPKTLYQGSTHVVMRVKAGDDSQGSIRSTWTGTSIIPDLNTPITVDHISYDINVADFYKSPIIDCAWHYVKEVRFSFYNKDVEAGFLNFVVPAGQTKSQFFSSANLRGSSWTDMGDATTLSFDGYTSGSASRRFLFEKTSDSCSDANTEEAWMMMLDTDHTACVDWDSDNTDLPAFLYSDTYPSVSTGYDLKPADLFIVAIIMEEGVFGGSCVSNCKGVADGSYHSCIGCNVYVTCSGEAMTYFVCRATQHWQATAFGVGSCQDSSTSCGQADAGSTCNPNGCSSGPCANGGTCSMVSAGGWQCACVAAWQGVDCSTEVDECASDPCVHGTCNDHVGSFTCTCEAGYTDTHCATDIDECASGPCQNGGTCNDAVNGYTCTCVAGYEGTHCQTNIDECASSPCENGNCVDGVNRFSCTCQAGWDGTTCSNNIDECASDPCQNGATCNDAVNSYTCTCAAGWQDTLCTTNINECASSPCQNGGQCNDGVNGYTCACTGGWSGTHCSSDVQECDSSPCQNGATCNDGINQFSCTCASGWDGTLCSNDIDECASGPCQNGGTCTDGVNGYTCACVAGYEGDNCATNINECASNPCNNGATCNDGVNRYTCACAAGYAGTHCDTDIDECASSPCQHGGTCTDAVNGYTCACAAGFEDSDCETNIDECASSPCQNGGTCNDGVNGYTCSCVDGWVDTHCDIDHDDCGSSPCENGGTCTDALASFTCECPDGTLGDTCMDDPCLPNPCLLGGGCTVNMTVATDYTPTCTCITGASGALCDDGPCEADPDYCQNDGVCSNVISGEGYSAEADKECDCTDTGYEGDDCSEGDGTIGLVAHQTGSEDSKKGGVASMLQSPLTIAAIAGAIAAICLLALIVLLRRRKKKKDEEDENENKPTQEDQGAGQNQNRPSRNSAWAGIGGQQGGAAAANARAPAPVARPAPSWDNSTDDFLDY